MQIDPLDRFLKFQMMKNVVEFTFLLLGLANGADLELGL